MRGAGLFGRGCESLECVLLFPANVIMTQAKIGTRREPKKIGTRRAERPAPLTNSSIRLVRLYTPIGKIILTVQILYNYTVPEILYELLGFRVVQFPLFVIVRLYTPIGKSQYNFLIITEALS